ncbi:hypothetical protein H4R18_004395 [Coemansia javaensis]|uniref:Uncharacterized protein n=1 Tax=Coemansia javaensis TaxID=2761396 RepID=A0A9W8LGA7_9FUNG|nr:hypothetical protein H4R18_004395 [Coemansia javaensis]
MASRLVPTLLSRLGRSATRGEFERAVREAAEQRTLFRGVPPEERGAFAFKIHERLGATDGSAALVARALCVLDMETFISLRVKVTDVRAADIERVCAEFQTMTDVRAAALSVQPDYRPGHGTIHARDKNAQFAAEEPDPPAASAVAAIDEHLARSGLLPAAAAAAAAPDDARSRQPRLAPAKLRMHAGALAAADAPGRRGGRADPGAYTVPALGHGSGDGFRFAHLAPVMGIYSMGVPVRCLVDPAAEIALVTKEAAARLGLPVDGDSRPLLVSGQPGARAQASLGRTQICIQPPDQAPYWADAAVVDFGHGWDVVVAGGAARRSTAAHHHRAARQQHQ